MEVRQDHSHQKQRLLSLALHIRERLMLQYHGLVEARLGVARQRDVAGRQGLEVQRGDTEHGVEHDLEGEGDLGMSKHQIDSKMLSWGSRTLRQAHFAWWCIKRSSRRFEELTPDGVVERVWFRRVRDGWDGARLSCLQSFLRGIACYSRTQNQHASSWNSSTDMLRRIFVASVRTLRRGEQESSLILL